MNFTPDEGRRINWQKRCLTPNNQEAMTTERIAKPVLRNLLASRLKLGLMIGFTFAVISGIGYKFGVMEHRKNMYAEFYKNYDPEEDFHRMRKLNLFQIVDSKGKMSKDF